MHSGVEVGCPVPNQDLPGTKAQDTKCQEGQTESSDSKSQDLQLPLQRVPPVWGCGSRRQLQGCCFAVSCPKTTKALVFMTLTCHGKWDTLH